MKIRFILKIFFLLLISHSYGFSNQSIHEIKILVNDEIITNYDIAQHFAINSILEDTRITEENSDQFYKNTIDNLIFMKLKKIKINEYNIIIENDEKDYYRDYFFESRNLDKEKVIETININNLDINVLNEIILISAAWQRLASGLFFHTVSISQDEVVEIMNKYSNLSPETAEKIIMNRQIQLKSDKFLRDFKSEANIEKR